MRIFKLRFYTLHLDFLTFHKMVLFYAIGVVRSSVFSDKSATHTSNYCWWCWALCRMFHPSRVYGCGPATTGAPHTSRSAWVELSGVEVFFFFSKILYRRRLTALQWWFDWTIQWRWSGTHHWCLLINAFGYQSLYSNNSSWERQVSYAGVDALPVLGFSS